MSGYVCVTRNSFNTANSLPRGVAYASLNIPVDFGSSCIWCFHGWNTFFSSAPRSRLFSRIESRRYHIRSRHLHNRDSHCSGTRNDSSRN